MTELPTTHILPPPGAGAAWDLCDECHAPLDERQRYCVVCGTRRRGGDDPAARYLAEATRRSGAAPLPVAAPRRGVSTTALILACVPLAVAIGVLAGRGQGGTDTQVLDVLKAQKAPVVNITGAAGAGAATATAGTATTQAAAAKAKAKAKAKAAADDKDVKRTSDGAKVLATGPTGSARQLEGSEVSAKQLEESKAAVKQINESKGEDYVDSQRNLPDQIVIP